MKTKADPVESALRAESRSEALDALRPRRALRMRDVLALTPHLRSFDEPLEELKVGVLRTYSTELLKPYWEFESLLQGFELDLYEGPFGSVIQQAQADTGLERHQPDVLYLLLRLEDVHPAMGDPLDLVDEEARGARIEEVVDSLMGTLGALRDTVSSLIVVGLLPPFTGPDLGSFDVMSEGSETGFRASLIAELAARMRASLADALVFDMQGLVDEIGREGLFDRRLWHKSRSPFSVAGSQLLVRRLLAYAARLKRPQAKCLVLDADDVLWGGIVGEEGPEGIALGPEHPGSVFVEFQRRLLGLRRRGLLLALCSKNNEADVVEVLRSHPHQLLREAHFAATRVNWEPKPGNIRDLAAELDLGLDSMVFIDDSPHECHAVAAELPEVTVIQTPADLIEHPACLEDLPQLEVLSLTEEDRRRPAMYTEQRQRRELAASGPEDYLRSLQMVMTVAVDDEPHLARIAQLTSKTNQFNLTTQRYGEAEVQAFMRDPDARVLSFSLADVFGDSGVVGVAIVKGVGGAIAEVDSFLMSCRVIGRRAEFCFLREVLSVCADAGVERIAARYIPSAKNVLVEGFWAEAGFSEVEPGRFDLELTGELPVTQTPITVKP